MSVLALRGLQAPAAGSVGARAWLRSPLDLLAPPESLD